MKNKKIRTFKLLTYLFTLLKGEFAPPNQAKPLCVKFGLKSHAMMASGDNKNNISLWRLDKDRPLTV